MLVKKCMQLVNKNNARTLLSNYLTVKCFTKQIVQKSELNDTSTAQHSYIYLPILKYMTLNWYVQYPYLSLYIKRGKVSVRQ